MTVDTLVSDPTLVSVLEAASRAREQSLAILDLIEQYHSDSPSEVLDEHQLALSKQSKLLNTHLAQLRGLNRKAVLGVRSTKQETAEARHEIDSLHLQLQNLFYEQKHLRGEIGACEDYQHKYQQLPMIAQAEFLAQHPEHAETSDHERTIARIQDEHAARQALEEQRQTLQKRKESLMRTVSGKKDELAKLDAEIEKWLAGEGTVRKMFELKEKKAQAVLSQIQASN